MMHGAVDARTRPTPQVATIGFPLQLPQVWQWNLPRLMRRYLRAKLWAAVVFCCLVPFMCWNYLATITPCYRDMAAEQATIFSRTDPEFFANMCGGRWSSIVTFVATNRFSKFATLIPLLVISFRSSTEQYSSSRLFAAFAASVLTIIGLMMSTLLPLLLLGNSPSLGYAVSLALLYMVLFIPHAIGFRYMTHIARTRSMRTWLFAWAIFLVWGASYAFGSYLTAFFLKLCFAMRSDFARSLIRLFIIPVVVEALRLGGNAVFFIYDDKRFLYFVMIAAVFSQVMGRMFISTMHSNTSVALLATIVSVCNFLVQGTASIRDKYLFSCAPFAHASCGQINKLSAAHFRLASIITDDASIFAYAFFLYLFNVSTASDSCSPPTWDLLVRVFLQYIIKSVFEVVPMIIAARWGGTATVSLAADIPTRANSISISSDAYFKGIGRRSSAWPTRARGSRSACARVSQPAGQEQDLVRSHRATNKEVHFDGVREGGEREKEREKEREQREGEKERDGYRRREQQQQQIQQMQADKEEFVAEDYQFWLREFWTRWLYFTEQGLMYLEHAMKTFDPVLLCSLAFGFIAHTHFMLSFPCAYFCAQESGGVMHYFYCATPGNTESVCPAPS